MNTLLLKVKFTTNNFSSLTLQSFLKHDSINMYNNWPSNKWFYDRLSNVEIKVGDY